MSADTGGAADVRLLFPNQNEHGLVRILNAFDRGGIKTVADLCAKTEHELLCLKNFGITSLSRVREALDAHGLHLASDVDMSLIPIVPKAPSALLDHFAGQALGEMLRLHCDGARDWGTAQSRAVSDAYDIAAAMLTERARRTEK